MNTQRKRPQGSHNLSRNLQPDESFEEQAPASSEREILLVHGRRLSPKSAYICDPRHSLCKIVTHSFLQVGVIQRPHGTRGIGRQVVGYQIVQALPMALVFSVMVL